MQTCSSSSSSCCMRITYLQMCNRWPEPWQTGRWSTRCHWQPLQRQVRSLNSCRCQSASAGPRGSPPCRKRLYGAAIIDDDQRKLCQLLISSLRRRRAQWRVAKQQQPATSSCLSSVATHLQAAGAMPDLLMLKIALANAVGQAPGS